MTSTSASSVPTLCAAQAAFFTAPRMNRRVLLVAAVIAFHVLGLWALQAGLLRRAVALVIPVQVVAEFIELPQPQVTPTPAQPAPVQKPTPVRKPEARPKPVAQPTPMAASTPEPSPLAPTAVSEPQAPAQFVETHSAPPAPPKVELPSSSASYLNNAPPRYPPLSKRLNEQGKVVVRALIEINGTASQASIKTSSGYERLDQTALQTVQSWRYVPGKRGGVPEAMWFNIPVNFVLE